MASGWCFAAWLRHEQVTVDGTSIHAVTAGPADAPAPLLLHGWPESWATWRELIPLAARSPRVVAIDLPWYRRINREAASRGPAGPPLLCLRGGAERGGPIGAYTEGLHHAGLTGADTAFLAMGSTGLEANLQQAVIRAAASVPGFQQFVRLSAERTLEEYLHDNRDAFL